MGDELDFLRWLAPRAGTGPGVAVGIGDDAAVLDAEGRGPLVLASDQTVEDVHFRAGAAPWPQVGRKALAKNLSDLAAMGARPWVALCSVAWPARHGIAALRATFDGLLEHARQEETTLVGGDVSSAFGPDGRASLDVSVLGLLEGRAPLLRSGARPGDELLVTGRLGGASHGHHLTFAPRWREGLALARSGRVHAAIDLSDGLALDLARLAQASGVGARVEVAALPLRALDGSRATVASAWGEGEDFELLVAAEPGALAQLAALPLLARCGLTRIGQVKAEPGLEAILPDGRVTTVPDVGYEHRLRD